MKLALGIFLVVTIIVSSSLFETGMASSGTICGTKCGVRCSKAGMKDRCLRYCGICCEQCNKCVPSGTYGNKDECPCYRDLKNSKNKSKCP